MQEAALCFEQVNMENRKKYIKVHIIVEILLTIGLIASDQITKLLAVRFLKGNSPFVLIDGVLELRYVENTGAAFGIFENKQWFFYIITVVIEIAVIIFIALIFLKLKKYCRFCEVCAGTFSAKTYNDMIGLTYILAALFAGAAGNLIDRVANRYVVDFIYFSIIDFPVFNFADILVTCSAVFLVIFFIFIYKEDKHLRLPGSKSD